jgi:hypothetical protein
MCATLEHLTLIHSGRQECLLTLADALQCHYTGMCRREHLLLSNVYTHLAGTVAHGVQPKLVWSWCNVIPVYTGTVRFTCRYTPATDTSSFI